MKFLLENVETDNLGKELTLQQTKYFKNSKVRDEYNRLVVCYHGTMASKFDIFEPTEGFNIDAIYFAKDEGVASHWAFSSYPRLFDKDIEKIQRKMKVASAQELFKIIKTYFDPKIKLHQIETGEWWLEEMGGVTSSYLGKETDKEDIYENEYGRQRDLKQKLKDILEYYIEQSADEKAGIYYVYLNIENPLIVEANKKSYWQIEFEGKKVNTESIAVIAKQRGYDGVIVKDVYETDYENILTDDYIVFNSNQIKSIFNENPTKAPSINENARKYR